MKPSDSALLLGLKGLNWHGQVCPCSLEMVTVPPGLCGPSVPPAAASPAGLDADVLGLDPLLHAVRAVLNAIRAIRALERLMLAVPSVPRRGAPGYPRGKKIIRVAR